MEGSAAIKTRGVNAVLRDRRIVFLNNTSAEEINFLIHSSQKAEGIRIESLEASENGNYFQIPIGEIDYILDS